MRVVQAEDMGYVWLRRRSSSLASVLPLTDDITARRSSGATFYINNAQFPEATAHIARPPGPPTIPTAHPSRPPCSPASQVPLTTAAVPADPSADHVRRYDKKQPPPSCTPPSRSSRPTTPPASSSPASRAKLSSRASPSPRNPTSTRTSRCSRRTSRPTKPSTSSSGSLRAMSLRASWP